MKNLGYTVTGAIACERCLPLDSYLPECQAL